MEQFLGVPSHEFVQRRVVPGDQPRHVLLVRVVNRGGCHGMAGGVADCVPPGIILLGFKVSC